MYKYIQIKSLSETYPNENICAVYNSHPVKNFTALAGDKRLNEALKDKECKLVVWRNDSDPSFYQGIDEYGRLRDMRFEEESESISEDVILKAMSESNKRVVLLEYDYKEKYPKENVISWKINEKDPLPDVRIAMRMKPDYIVIKMNQRAE